MPPRQRVLRRATVVASERLSPQLVRLTFDCPDLVGVELPYTDHYIKILFPPAGASYAWPFDPEAVKRDDPGSAPVTRTYSLRSHDTATGRTEIDFVVHADGLAGPWAEGASIGDEIGFYGPGGAWAPATGFDHFVLAGDEAAAPAICAALEALPPEATATAFLEIADDAAVFPVPARAGVDVVWVPRNGAPYGQELARRVRATDQPEGRVGWFVHGVADMVKDLRRYLFVERGIARSDVSISGYWRSGMNEDGWQSSKHTFVEAMDAEEAAAGQTASSPRSADRS